MRRHRGGKGARGWLRGWETALLLVVVPASARAQQHFQPVAPTGLPYAVAVQCATWDGDTLLPGDEIGLYDDDLCVGAVLLDGTWAAAITAWQGDSNQGLEGFTPGHTIRFRVYSVEHDVERPASATYTQGDGTFGSGFATLVSLLEAASDGVPSQPDHPTQPTAFAFEAAYPNPFNPTLTVVISLPVSSPLRVEAYSLLGRHVATVAKGFYPAGERHFTFDASHLASGTYLVRASVPGKRSLSRRVQRVK